MREVRSVVIAGWFGSDNFGDELLLHTLITLLREGGVTRVRVLGADPERVRAVHGVDARVISPTTKAGKVADARALWTYLRDTDLFVVGPGTVLQERSPTVRSPGTLPLFLRLLLLARARRVPTALVGVAVREGGSRPGNLLVRLIGAMAGTVLTRDDVSASLLGHGARAIGDVAFAWQPPEASRPASERPGRYAVSLKPMSRWPGHGAPWSNVQEVCRRLGASGACGTFLAFGQSTTATGENDVEVFRDAFDDLLTLDVPPMPGAGAEWVDWVRSMAGVDALVATRLHAAVVGVKMGVPTVALAYEDKVRRTFALLGLEHLVLPVDAPASEVLQRLDAARDHACASQAGALFAERAEVVRDAVAELLRSVARR